MIVYYFIFYDSKFRKHPSDYPFSFQILIMKDSDQNSRQVVLFSEAAW